MTRPLARRPVQNPTSACASGSRAAFAITSAKVCPSGRSSSATSGAESGIMRGPARRVVWLDASEFELRAVLSAPGLNSHLVPVAIHRGGEPVIAQGCGELSLRCSGFRLAMGGFVAVEVVDLVHAPVRLAHAVPAVDGAVHHGAYREFALCMFVDVARPGADESAVGCVAGRKETQAEHGAHGECGESVHDGLSFVAGGMVKARAGPRRRWLQSRSHRCHREDLGSRDRCHPMSQHRYRCRCRYLGRRPDHHRPTEVAGGSAGSPGGPGWGGC